MRQLNNLLTLQHQWLIGALLFCCLILPRQSQAHKLKHTRIVHILIPTKSIEVYLNLLLPKHAKVELWRRLFDRNGNRKLEPKERLALGRYLGQRYLKALKLQANQQPLTLHLSEVENSRIRGDIRRHRYAWDYHFHAPLPPKLVGKQIKLRFQLPLLFAKEIIPVALVPLKGQRLKATKTSYLLTKNERKWAICRIDRNKRSCLFQWKPAKPMKKRQNYLKK